MTEEAKVVFANAVAYIAQFRGPILARRFDGYMPTRTTVKDMRYLNSHAAYNDELKFLNNMKHLQDSLYGALAERQAKGEKLGAQEEVFLKGYQPMEVQMRLYENDIQTTPLQKSFNQTTFCQIVSSTSDIFDWKII